MCAICKATAFYNNPMYETAVDMMVNGSELKMDGLKDFAFAALYREAMKVALGVKQDDLCDNHKNMTVLVGSIEKGMTSTASS